MLQAERKYGFRMLLHMVLAAHSPSAEDYVALLDKLREVDRLAERCRSWVCDLLRAPEAQQDWPSWIAGIMGKVRATDGSRATRQEVEVVVIE